MVEFHCQLTNLRITNRSFGELKIRSQLTKFALVLALHDSNAFVETIDIPLLFIELHSQEIKLSGYLNVFVVNKYLLHFSKVIIPLLTAVRVALIGFVSFIDVGFELYFHVSDSEFVVLDLLLH